MSEKEFLESTPKKVFQLAAIHQEMNTPKDDKSSKKDELQEVYIDNIF